jgi:hypothetical protein
MRKGRAKSVDISKLRRWWNGVGQEVTVVKGKMLELVWGFRHFAVVKRQEPLVVLAATLI